MVEVWIHYTGNNSKRQIRDQHGIGWGGGGSDDGAGDGDANDDDDDGDDDDDVKIGRAHV